jgi:hypothetical protein
MGNSAGIILFSEIINPAKPANDTSLAETAVEQGNRNLPEPVP